MISVQAKAHYYFTSNNNMRFYFEEVLYSDKLHKACCTPCWATKCLQSDKLNAANWYSSVFCIHVVQTCWLTCGQWPSDLALLSISRMVFFLESGSFLDTSTGWRQRTNPGARDNTQAHGHVPCTSGLSFYILHMPYVPHTYSIVHLESLWFSRVSHNLYYYFSFYHAISQW